MEDAIALASALDLHGDDLERALTDYELERQPVVERFQEAARESASYFENVGRYATFEPLQFAFNLLTRSGRITHLELEKRDPAFIARVDAAYAATESALAAPPPMLTPLTVGGGRSLPNRLATVVPSRDDAHGGVVSAPQGERLLDAVRSGVGLVLTEAVAVSPEGRITPGTPGLWNDEHGAAWRDSMAEMRTEPHGATVALLLTHGGRRASVRPRAAGADRPLRDDGWETLAPSPLPYSPRHPAPRQASADDLDRVADAFASAARRAAAAGVFDLLMIDMAHGHLLASFLSPLTNRRDDEYGGPLEGRMRFALEAFARTRAAWPSTSPLGVRLHCSDWARDGFVIDDAVAVARALRDSGCDIIEVAAGGTVPRSDPDYRRLFLVPFADRIRNDAGVPVMVGGNVAKPDDANTILAAGRADVCVIDRRLYAT